MCQEMMLVYNPDTYDDKNPFLTHFILYWNRMMHVAISVLNKRVIR